MLEISYNCLRYLSSLLTNFFFKKKIFYIIEYKKWANFNDAKNLKKYFKNKLLISNEITGIRNSIIHLGTHYKLFKKKKIINYHNSNKLFIFWPHLDRKNRISNLLKKNISKIEKINTTCIKTKKDLFKFGIPNKKITVTPLSVDTEIFKYPNKKEKKELRKKFLIPNNKFVIGSFVKDGIGFGKGIKPKKLKNPQMLIKAINGFEKKNELFVILSGPARGYIKKKLKDMKIDFIHKNCLNQKELSELYRLVDVTIINSNIEGGPYSLLESLASGVPVLSTKVGMSIEVIKNGVNGYLININDHINLNKKLFYLFKNKKKLKKMKKNCIKSVKKFSINSVGKTYLKKFYNLI